MQRTKKLFGSLLFSTSWQLTLIYLSAIFAIVAFAKLLGRPSWIAGIKNAKAARNKAGYDEVNDGKAGMHRANNQ